jgi:hypothetical protein
MGHWAGIGITAGANWQQFNLPIRSTGMLDSSVEEGRREKRDASEEAFAGERRSRARNAGGSSHPGSD